MRDEPADSILDAGEAARLLVFSRRLLLMHRLTEREQQIAEVILEWSFARNRTEALIPELRFFCTLTGIDNNKHSSTPRSFQPPRPSSGPSRPQNTNRNGKHGSR